MNTLDPELHPLDLLRAGRWSRALFGTYALSLGFFEAAPLHALRRAGARDIRIVADVSGVAGALGEAGAREVGRSYAVEPILVQGGCFHPKFLLVEGDAGPRLLVGSGNLTFGGWGRNLELAEVLSPSAAPAAFADMATFLADLGQAPRVSSSSASTFSTWSDLLRQGSTSEDGPRILHNLASPIADQIAGMADRLGGAERLVVASPYFGRAAAARRLARLLGLERIHVHVPARLPLGGEVFDFERDGGAVPVTVEALEESSPRPMHAKLLEIVCDAGTLEVSGSVNASGPALASSANVELAVVRTSVRRLSIRQHTGPFPERTEEQDHAEASSEKVLSAVLLGRRLSGTVFASGCSGLWSARLDATGEFRDLGDVDVGEDRGFTAGIDAADEIGFGSRRAVLVLHRPGERISGFVTFPDLIELNRRWGAHAGSILRVVNGSDDDEDLAGALEYFASHADDSIAPWRAGSEDRRTAASESADRLVSFADLDVRPRAGNDHAPIGSWGTGAMERLLSALRRTIAKGRASGSRSGGEEEEDDQRAGRHTKPPERADGIFALLREVLAERIPDDPVPELHRLADLGTFVLSRRPDPERLAEFVQWWCRLAVKHLRCPSDRPDLQTISALFILLDALPRRAAKEARRRLASILGGSVAEVLASLEADPLPPRLGRLVEEASPGRSAILTFVPDVAKEASTFEELPALVAAIRAGIAPPPLPRLDAEPEMARVRAAIARGHAARLPLARRSATSCPKCSIGLPESDRERLRQVGLVVARNCCARVIVVAEDLG